MRAYEIIVESEGLWYHGSGMDFDLFDTSSKKINRGQNPSGIYITNDQDEAEEYASGLFSMDTDNKNNEGTVYIVSITANNPYIYISGQSKITDEMAVLYSDYLKKHFNYGDDWIDNHIIPSYKKDGRFKEIPGSVKTKILQSGGYDSWKDGRHVAVFDAGDIKIIKKYKVSRNIIEDRNGTEYNFVNSNTFTHETPKRNADAILQHGFKNRMDGTYFNVGKQSFTNGHCSDTHIHVKINISDDKILFYKDMPDWVKQMNRASLASYCRMHGYSAWADNLQINVYDSGAIEIIKVITHDKNS